MWGELLKEEQELIAIQDKFKDMNLCLDESRRSRKKKSEREKTSNREEEGQESRNNKKVPRWKLENKNSDKNLDKSGKKYY